MFSGTLKELVILVVTSWEVIVVTVVLVLFMYLVGYVSRKHHRPLFVSNSKPKKNKAAKPAKIEPKPEDEITEDGNA